MGLRIPRERQESRAGGQQAEGADDQRNGVRTRRVTYSTHPEWAEARREDKGAVKPAVDAAELHKAEISSHEKAHQVELGTQRKAQGDRRDGRIGRAAEQQRYSASRTDDAYDDGDVRREDAIHEKADDHSACDDRKSDFTRGAPGGKRIETGVQQHWHEVRKQSAE